MTPLQIYLWQQADTLNHSVAFAASLAFIGSVATFLWFFMHEKRYSESKSEYENRIEKDHATGKRCLKVFVPITTIMGLMAALMPSSKTIALMVALPAIANSEPIQKDLPELYKLAVDALKQQITK